SRVVMAAPTTSYHPSSAEATCYQFSVSAAAFVISLFGVGAGGLGEIPAAAIRQGQAGARRADWASERAEKLQAAARFDDVAPMCRWCFDTKRSSARDRRASSLGLRRDASRLGVVAPLAASRIGVASVTASYG